MGNMLRVSFNYFVVCFMCMLHLCVVFESQKTQKYIAKYEVMQ
jgi:hypothetical protein